MKIDVKQVLSEAVTFYKNNFKSLARVSFVILLFTVFIHVAGYIPSVFNENTLLITFFGLTTLVIGLVSIVIVPKLYLTMLILINSLLAKKEMNLKEAYRQTKGKYWLMVGCSFLLALWFIPYMVLIFMKIPFAVAIGAVYVAFILSFYYTLLPMIAIEPRTKQYLKKSTQMIKGNYTAVLILTFITTTFLTVINGIISYIFQEKTTEMFIVGMVNAFTYFFAYPFASTVTIIVYRKLNKRSTK